MKVERILELIQIVSDFDDYEYESWTIKDLREYSEHLDHYDVSEEQYNELVDELENFGAHLEQKDQWGGEDEGSSYGVVFKVGPYFFRGENTYASHAGLIGEWDVKQVFAKVVEQTIYE